MKVNRSNISGFVLAGGKSSRMGKDKGLIEFKGKKMVEHATQALEGLCSNISIISNQDEYEAFPYLVYADIVRDKGPLAGICTALTQSKTEVNVIISCDSPFVSSALLSYLFDQLEDFDAVVPAYQGRVYPLTAIYNKSCLEALNESLSKDELKVKEVIKSLNTKIIELNVELPFFNERLMTNINTPKELELHES